ncbi:MAG: hypothetical protein GF317_10885 [Candidatus Lokiarchaeota archaeon]|nr:hypothetical protein [Candidatus Lokiarchaeota archaeon]MBD3200167.1 hypothetical protein [Candidatus Lokiarchaeota archaeon]
MIRGRDYFLTDGNKNDRNLDILTSIKTFTKEELLSKKLDSITSQAAEIEDLKSKFAEIVQNNIEALDFSDLIQYPKYFIKEAKIKKSVEGSNIAGLNMVSVDGSSVIKRFMTLDLSFLKAIAVKYYFNSNQDAKIEYFPDLDGFNNYNVDVNNKNESDNAIDTNTSINMNFLEINLLNRMIEKTNDIDLIIIDGSVVIMPINLLFAKERKVSEKYDKLLKEYKRLYKNCKENKIVLVGSIKDTRTSALTNLLRDSIQYLKPNYDNLKDFIEINYRQTMDYFSDLDLFNRILKINERSCIFNCKTDIDKIRDTGIKKEIPYYFPLSFYAFYLKTTLYDLPCRIEFFVDEDHKFEYASKRADLISSLILPISNLNNHYGLPIPQIEAHKRAAFNHKEIQLLFNNVKRKLAKQGVFLLERRRNRRPF